MYGKPLAHLIVCRYMYMYLQIVYIVNCLQIGLSVKYDENEICKIFRDICKSIINISE